MVKKKRAKRPGRINIAIAGGPCTGKSTTAAALFAHLKELGYDYDLVPEESRKLKGEFGKCRSVFDRFYLWLQQEREEVRSRAHHGFVTDAPLFQYYAQARMWARGERDMLAVRELFRQSLKLDRRYQLIVMAEDPDEIPYKVDKVRSGRKADARERHRLLRTFVEHQWNGKLLLVKGTVAQRVRQIMRRLRAMGLVLPDEA